MESKVVISELGAMGEFVRSVSSPIEAPVIRLLRERLAARQASQAPPKVASSEIDEAEEEAFLAAIDATITYFNDGDLVEGTVVGVDSDQVLVDIGYKTDGVILSSELSGEDDADARDVVKIGDHIEAYVLVKEDRTGRLILSRKRARLEPGQDAFDEIQDGEGDAAISHARRDTPPGQPSAPASEAREFDSMRELLASWDALRKLVPDGQDPISFLASRTGLRPGAIAQVRRTRNQYAHPDDGWPGPYDVDMALATARESLRRLRPSSGG